MLSFFFRCGFQYKLKKGKTTNEVKKKNHYEVLLVLGRGVEVKAGKTGRGSCREEV